MILVPSSLEQSFYLISPYTGSGIEAGLAEWVLSSLSVGSAGSVQPATGLVWRVRTVSLRRLLLVGMTRSWAFLLPRTAPRSPMHPLNPNQTSYTTASRVPRKRTWKLGICRAWTHNGHVMAPAISGWSQPRLKKGDSVKELVASFIICV